MSSHQNTYALLDSGNFEKLEQVGLYRLIRPAPQAIWKPRQSKKLWDSADAHYFRSKSGGGHWKFKQKLPEKWTVQYYGLAMQIKLTNFGHLGISAEQGENWDWIQSKISESKKKTVRVLNTFAYTGGSTIAAAKAGAEIVHLDAARGIVDWARENAELSAVSRRPIRWIVDDVTKFVSREIRRGNKYDAIILDPPSFGRGTKNEVWKLENDLPKLLDLCRQLLTPKPIFVLLSAHTPGFTALAMENLLGDMMRKHGGKLESMEMTIPEEKSGRRLPSGSMARWSALGDK